MSNEDEEYTDPGIGLGSPVWMSRAIALYAPQRNLFRGISGMFDYLVREEDPDIYEALDYFVQIMVNGVYTDPYQDDEGSVTAEDNSTITEDEIQKFMDILGVNKGEEDE